MNPRLCSRCLSRVPYYHFSALNASRIPKQQSNIPTTALFSTSTPLAVNPPKKKASSGADPKKPARGAKQTFTKVKKKAAADQPRDRGKRPGPGERKAFRKRIVLSNPNALEVAGLQDMKMELINDDRFVGTVVGIPDPVVVQLRAVEAFKPSQAWPLFRRPAMLVRKETIEYAKTMEEIGKEGGAQTVRKILVGDRGSGKSLMLLQAMAMAMLQNWVVINIPDAMEITIAHTEYAPLPGTSPTEYVQPNYSAYLLNHLARANPILSSLTLSEQASVKESGKGTRTSTGTSNVQATAARGVSYTELPPFPPTINLLELAQLGASSPQSSHAILTLLLSELKLPSRPPLLLCLDGLGFAMRETKYISGTDYRPIHAHDFSIIRTFLSHLSGAQSLGPSGGMVLAATSESNRPRVEALNMALTQLESSNAPSANTSSAFTLPFLPLSSLPEAGLPQPGAISRDPFKKYDERVMSSFTPTSLPPSGPTPTDPAAATSSREKKLEVHRIPGLSREETGGLMEYWARSGIYRGRVDEKVVGEKWSLSGGGLVGELERGTVRGRL